MKRCIHRPLVWGLAALLLVVNARSVRAEEPPAPSAAQLARDQARHRSCAQDPRVRLGLTSEQSCVGAELFFRETFEGNGRTCGTCHPAGHNFTIDPASISRLPASDPLFVAETEPALAGLENSLLLRALGVNVVNADGFDDLQHKFVARSVPHTLSLATSILAPDPRPGNPAFAVDGTRLPPNQRTGWSGDGAPGNGELLDFSDGAIQQHLTRSLARVPGVDFVLPTAAEREALTTFMLNLGRLADVSLADLRFSDPGAERGRQSFLSGPAQDCSVCHDNASANGAFVDANGLLRSSNFSFDIGTERARPAVLDQEGVPFDGGFGLRALDLNGDGVLNDGFGNGSFNVPPLIEAADTGPFFHTNGPASIEDAIRFYTTAGFGDSRAGRAPTALRPDGGPIALTEAEIADLGRFLRAINAAFNCQLASQRLDAVRQIDRHFGARFAAIERGLVELALAEIDDAFSDLQAVDDFGPEVQRRLHAARTVLRVALRARVGPAALGAIARVALREVQRAQSGLGSGLGFQLGDANVLF